MEFIPIILSIFALALGGFNFYWAFLRDRKRFYLLNVQSIGAFMKPEFALVNGGKEDILIVNLACSFKTKEGKASFYPKQKIEFNEGNSLLLQAGKAFHCKVSFPEPFTPSFALKGTKENGVEGPIYHYEMWVNLEWVEPDGHIHQKNINLMKYGFDESGGIKSRSSRENKFDLYRK